MVRYKRLQPNEIKRLEDFLKEKGITKKEIAMQLGMYDRKVYAQLSGIWGLHPSVAQHIYTQGKEDWKILFLRRYFSSNDKE